jgi:hypothetical protein
LYLKKKGQGETGELGALSRKNFAESNFARELKLS